VIAPQRIWAFPPTPFEEWDVWQAEPHEDAIEYVRADLVEAAVRRALEWAAELCVENTMDIPMDRSARVYAGMFWAGEHTGGTHQGMGYADFIRSATPDQIAKLAKGEP